MLVNKDIVVGYMAGKLQIGIVDQAVGVVERHHCSHNVRGKSVEPQNRTAASAHRGVKGR